MDKIDLDELERLHKAATPGPWRVRSGSNYAWIEPFDFPHSQLVARAWTCQGDAEYITAACNAVPELIARVRELEEWCNRAIDEAGYLLGCMPALDCRVCDYHDYCPEPMPGFEPDIETCRATMRNFCNPNGEPINKEAGE